MLSKNYKVSSDFYIKFAVNDLLNESTISKILPSPKIKKYKKNCP